MPIPSSGSSSLRLISTMITPAILILATGSLVSSTLVRLARIVDRSRLMLADIERYAAAGDTVRAGLCRGWLPSYVKRVSFVERALSLYYIAIGLFVAGSLAIAVDDLTKDSVPWLSLVLVVCGALALFTGTAMLVIETHLAAGQLRHEIDQLSQRPSNDKTKY